MANQWRNQRKCLKAIFRKYNRWRLNVAYYINGVTCEESNGQLNGGVAAYVKMANGRNKMALM
jgi:hypothetical protein